MVSHVQDAALADELKAHHAVMLQDLDRLSAELADAAMSGAETNQAKRDLERWVADVLIPHAEEEEVTTYKAAHGLPEARLLIDSMLLEHGLIRQMAGQMSEAQEPVAAATYGRALFDIFDSHQGKENDLILPLLVDAHTVSLTDVMASVHGHEHGHGHGHGHEHGHGHDSPHP